MIAVRNVVVGFSILAYGCTVEQAPYVSNPTEIMRIDSLMSVRAQRSGFHEALLYYASDDFVKFEEGQLPAIGKRAYEERTGGKLGTTALKWQPVSGEVAKSGDLGYTWGNWVLTTNDTVYHGNYFSVWRRDSEGAWKLVLDGGNTTPPQ